MKPAHLTRSLSLLSLGLVFALLISAGASLYVLAAVAFGALLILAACFLADRGMGRDGN